MKDFDHLVNHVNSYPSDIRAEVLLADLLLAGLSPSDLLIFFTSSFKRGYSNDILKAEKLPLNNGKEILGISLARDGLYDLLPEGLFHTSPDSALSSGKGMASDSKKDSKIEEETRKFFLPFENEFFYQRVLLELRERSILQKLNDNSLEDFFLDFWRLDRSLPEGLIIKLSAILPFIRDIVGDFRLTANCLGAILGEEVTHTIQYKSTPCIVKAIDQADYGCCLGRTDLGVSSVIGSQSPENCKLIRFIIGPLENSGIEPYLENGDIARFIGCFFRYFIPMEIDTEFNVILPAEQQKFILGTDKVPTIMGYNTVI
ncbi:MAG: hypothetical protein WCE64_06945 [Bacteroidales bacterium]